jgi:hypothetical protein
MNEYEAHLSSYDHSHKQRLKDMKQMVRDPQAAARARKQEAKAEGVISIKLGPDAGGGAAGGGFKKGGFKKTGFKAAFAPNDGGKLEGEGAQQEVGKVGEPVVAGLGKGEEGGGDLVESDTEDEGYEVYDPRHPTD